MLFPPSLVGIPLALALVTRGFFILIRKQTFFQERFLPAIGPLSLIALLFTTLIIFAAQGKQVVKSITDVLRVVPPLLVYFLILFFGLLYSCKRAKVSYGRTATQAFTGTPCSVIVFVREPSTDLSLLNFLGRRKQQLRIGHCCRRRRLRSRLTSSSCRYRRPPRRVRLLVLSFPVSLLGSKGDPPPPLAESQSSSASRTFSSGTAAEQAGTSLTTRKAFPRRIR